MPHFCPECHNDTFLCQKCGKVYCSNEKCKYGTKYHWSPEITGNEGAGAVCERCFFEYIHRHSGIKLYKNPAYDLMH